MSFIPAQKQYGNREAGPKTSTLAKSSKQSKRKENIYYNSTADSSTRMIHLQKSIGNQAIQKLMQVNLGFDMETGIQPKLKVSRPGDTYEQEADKVS